MPEPQNPELTVWALDPTGQLAPEVLLTKREPLELIGASPDGRFWLLQRPDVVEASVIHGVLLLYEFATGTFHEGPISDTTLLPAKWSGKGFWVDPLVHADLQLQLDTCDAIRAAAGLTTGVQVLDGSFSADRQQVALLTWNGKGLDQRTVALRLVRGAGGAVQVLPDVVQPWDSKAGARAYLSLSPDGRQLVISSRSPGDALVDVAAPNTWVPLGGEFVPPADIFDSSGRGPTGPPLWTADGKLFWLPPASIMTASGQRVVHLSEPSPWAVWSQDGTMLAAAGPASSQEMRLIRNGQVERFPAPEGARPFAFLPDGRVLAARTR